MNQPYDHVTVNCSKDTRSAIKHLAKFCNMTQRDILKYLLMEKGILPSDGTMNVFDNWDNVTLTKFLRYMGKINKEES